MNESRAQAIARVMASMGFRPKNEFDASFVEYYKDYADQKGHMARATAIFNKGIMGIDHAKLESFVVTTQAHLPAVVELIQEEVPKVMEPDLLHILKQLGGAEILAPQAIVQIQCARCNKMTPEYFMDARSDTPLCPVCFKHKVGADVAEK